MEFFFNNPLLFGEETLNSSHLFIGRWFDLCMIAVTGMGSELFYTLMLPVLYWCYDKKNTIKIGTVFLFSAALNDMLKEIFQNPRPDPENLLEGIKQLNIAYLPDSPGFPSGHTQNTASFFGSIVYLSKNIYIRIFSILLILLIPYSRLYLAVHYLGDVLGGYLFGFMTLFILFPIFVVIGKRTDQLNETILSAGIIFFSMLVYKIIPGNSVSKIMGTFAGFLVGTIYAETRIRFDPKGNFAAGIIKTFTGLVSLLAIKSGLKAILPPLPLSEFARYFVMGFWVTFIAPYVFSRYTLLRGNAQKSIADA